MNPYSVLISPIVSEKSGLLDKQGKYTFKVAPSANKRQIASAVESVFKVDVVSVNTLNLRGEVKNYRGRPSKKPDWKKAIVTLAANQSIPIYEGA